MTKHAADIAAILSRRHDNGADYWATADGRISKGSPFTTLESVLMLAELGVEPESPVLRGAAALILSAQQDDGRFRVAPGGAIYPCHTINAARVLSYLGFIGDPRLDVTVTHLLGTVHDSGGWRCRKFSYGRGPETEFANPGPTLAALDVFRLAGLADHDASLDAAVELLLGHWSTRAPLGPCHYGIGTLFMQVAYPFASYNLFFWVYVLSFYRRAREDSRFLEALHALQSTMVGGQIVVQRPHQKLRDFTFCRQGEPSALATERYREIERNLE